MANKLAKLLNIQSDDELFERITNSFRSKITQWDYFVNWGKVFANMQSVEVELNILNSLIGKEQIEEEFVKLLKTYPQVAKAIPYLLAVRESNLEILIDAQRFIYKNYRFSGSLKEDEYQDLADFLSNSGLAELFRNRKIKNLTDYVVGVEVGLDSNGRKNRIGTLMENIVEVYVAQTCAALGLSYLPQASASKIKTEWGLDVVSDKSERKIDFAINANGKLFFIECNFYSGGGSKLKSTATEYQKMSAYWNEQKIDFIWVTDGFGWQKTLKPLREYFDKADYLLNLELLRQNVLTQIIQAA